MSVVVGGTLGVTYPDGTTTPASEIDAAFSPYITDTANVMTIGATTSGAPVKFNGSVGVTTPVGTYVSNRVTLSYTYATNTANASLNVTSLSGYVAGITDITITVNSGVYLYSTSTANAGLTLTGGTTGDTITLVNNGYIMGKGGNGYGCYTPNAYTSVASTAGGPALSLGFNTTIDNTNASAYIGGGGGGGGGGESGASTGGGGGAGGGNGGGSWTNGCCASYSTYGGSGGGVGSLGSNGTYNTILSAAGGGRIFPGTGGTGARPWSTVALGGGAGGGGALQGNYGYPGDGGSANNPGGNAASSSAYYTGGGGGGWGASGGSGVDGTAGYKAGSAGGKAVSLNGKTVTWVSGNTTRVYGAIS